MDLSPRNLAIILKSVERAMSPTLIVHGVEFVIPVDCKIGVTSLHSADMIELSDLELPNLKAALSQIKLLEIARPALKILDERKGAAQ